MRAITFLFSVFAFAAAGPGCLRFECASTDVECRPEALLLYASEPDCNLTQSVNFGALAQQEYFKASNPDDCDEYGTSIALDCRTQTLAIGAPNESSGARGINGNQFDNSAASSGAVYVYRFRNGAWALEAYIKASNADASDSFGFSVDLDRDTLVVGALTEASGATGVDGDQNDNSLTAPGAAYVFRRDGNDVWTQEAYIKASNTDAQDRFGRTVAIDRDVLAVGTSAEASATTGVNGVQSDNSVTSAGAVYVFRRTGTQWAQEAYIKASNTGASDSFGLSIDLEAPENDLAGYTLAVGARGESSNGVGVDGDQSNDLAANSGAVYVFRSAGNFWYQEAYIKASNAEAGDSFGAVSLSGDLLAVGAIAESSDATGVGGAQNNNNRNQSGAVYVFRRFGAAWVQEAYIKSSNPDLIDQFGARVSLSGDALAVSTAFEDSNAAGVNGNQGDNTFNNAGAAYLFRFSNGNWSQSAYIKASNPDANDAFGFVLDLSGDGLAISSQIETSNAAGVGADQSNNLGAAVGAAYVFR